MIERGKIEWKTRVQALATFLIATAGLAWIAESSSDFVHGLPDFLEAPAYAAILAVGGMLSGYVAKHKPDMLSGSAVLALRERVRGRDDWHPTEEQVAAVRQGVERIKRRT